MAVKIKFSLSREATALAIKLGKQWTKAPRRGDIGIDLRALQSTVVPGRAERVVTIRTGLHLGIDILSIGGQIEARSGHAMQGLLILGGVTDPTYRGELVVICGKIGPGMVSIAPGERFAQLVLINVPEFELEEVVLDDLPESERGTDGFGSTGKE